jgi:hypothetical protein
MAECQAPIEQHERLHVEDARRIVSADLPTKLKSEPTFKKYFIDRAPIPERTYFYMLPNKMADIVAAEFAKLWNKKKDELDTPAKSMIKGVFMDPKPYCTKGACSTCIQAISERHTLRSCVELLLEFIH